MKLILAFFLLTIAPVLTYAGEAGSGLKHCGKCHRDKSVREYRHGPIASGQCVPCHSDTFGNHHDIREEVRQLGIQDGAFCYRCHRGIAGKPVVHAPVAGGQCLGCHVVHDSDAPAFLKGQRDELCYRCHQQAPFKKRYQHAPVKEGRCLDCHTHHLSDEKSLLRSASLCLDCHGNELFSKASRHEPVTKGRCLDCHDAHSSGYPQLLRNNYAAEFHQPYSAEAYALCFDCHKESAFTQAQSVATGFRNGTHNLHHYHLVRKLSRSCRTCHDVHSTDQALLMKGQAAGWKKMVVKLSFQRTADGGECAVTCHKPVGYDRTRPVSYEKLWQDDF